MFISKAVFVSIAANCLTSTRVIFIATLKFVMMSSNITFYLVFALLCSLAVNGLGLNMRMITDDCSSLTSCSSCAEVTVC